MGSIWPSLASTPAHCQARRPLILSIITSKLWLLRNQRTLDFCRIDRSEPEQNGIAHLPGFLSKVTTDSRKNCLTIEILHKIRYEEVDTLCPPVARPDNSWIPLRVTAWLGAKVLKFFLHPCCATAPVVMVQNNRFWSLWIKIIFAALGETRNGHKTGAFKCSF